jgi:hypothetical protein
MANRRLIDRIRAWVYAHIPKWMQERDFEIFTALLCFVAGIPLLITNDYRSGAIEETLPFVLVKLWAIVLTVAPVLIFLGIVKSVRIKTYPKKAVWLRIEALGLTGLAYVGYVYALSIISTAGREGVVAAAIVLVFSLTCHSREIGIQVELEHFREGLGLDAR